MTKEAMKRALCVYLDAFENHLITNATSSNLDMTGHIAELVKEALAHCPDCGQLLGDAGHIHTCSPQRTWVGLTWEEIDECFKITPDQYLPAQIYKRIEAKLKQKNGYTEEKNT